MERDIRVGDVILTKHEEYYMITRQRVGLYDIYMATTLGTDYIGTLCYYNTRHETIQSLLNDIEEEEGIQCVITKEELQDTLFKI